MCIVHFNQRPFLTKRKFNIPLSMRNLQVPLPIILKPTKEGCNPISEKKTDTLTLDIKMQPGDANLEMVTLTVGILKNGTPEELLKFKTKLLKTFRGQGLTTGSAQYAMSQNLLKGKALRAFDFEIKAMKDGVETTAHHPAVLNEMIKHFFLIKALI